MIYYVYIHKNLRGEIFYVGQGKGGRAFSTTDKRSIHWTEASKDGFTAHIIKNNLTQQQAWELEIATIRLYRGCGLPLVNKSSGGQFPASGIVHTLETKSKLRQAHLGRTVSEVTRKKIGMKSRGRKLSPDAKMKLSKHARQRTGSRNSFFGKRHSTHTKSKISKCNTGRSATNRMEVINDITGDIFPSAEAASKALGIKRSTLSDYLLGRIKNNKGFRYRNTKTNGSK